MKPINILLKNLEFNTENQYFNYIVESYINGQKKQASDLFNDLYENKKTAFYNWYVENNEYKEYDQSFIEYLRKNELQTIK